MKTTQLALNKVTVFLNLPAVSARTGNQIAVSAQLVSKQSERYLEVRFDEAGTKSLLVYRSGACYCWTSLTPFTVNPKAVAALFSN